MITNEVKKQISTAIEENMARFENKSSHMSRFLEISPSAMSRIRKGDFEQVISNSKWIDIAVKLNVKLGTNTSIKTAKTPVFEYITQQLTFCQENSVSGLLCDRADIGKTHAARIYALQHRNAIRVDCSQAKTKRYLLQEIAREFGLTNTGWTSNIFKRVVFPSWLSNEAAIS